MEKHLIVFGSDSGVIHFIIKDIKRVISDELEIQGLSDSSPLPPMSDFPVVLTTHHFLVDKARQVFPRSIIIPGRKMINGNNLEKIVALPPQKKVLVASSLEIGSYEIIQNLHELGLDHPIYIPFWKGREADLEGIDTAVIPGMTHLCPPGIENIIDIGYRLLSVGTFLDLITALDLSIDYLERYVKHYNNLLMHNSRRISDVLRHSEMMRKKQEIVLQEVSEGIIYTNHADIITLANPVIENMLGVGIHALTGRKISDVFPNVPQDVNNPLSADAEEFRDLFLSINGQQVICNKLPVINGDDKNFIYTFKKVEEIQRLEEKVRRELYKKGYIAKYNFSDIWGNDKNLKLIKEKAKDFARTDETILITGESGTGKELLAQAIHLNSRWKNGPFLAMNFAAIPETLVESELFGYEGGAFTGARKEGKPGIFELARMGTIFLDEIGDAPLNIQARLLRVLQEKEIMRIGGFKVIPVNVRIIAATNQDLLQSVASKQFRQDLFYRLNVLPIELLPLRMRKDDITIIIERYLKVKYGAAKKLSPEVIDMLYRYNWPGNIRELMNVVDYFYHVLQGRESVLAGDIPSYITNALERAHHDDDRDLTKHLLGIISDEDELREVGMILHLLNKNPRLPRGRNKLMSEIRRNNGCLSEHRLKKYLNVLSSCNLIKTGKTRQGTVITSQGIAFLDRLAARHPSKRKI